MDSFKEKGKKRADSDWLANCGSRRNDFLESRRFGWCTGGVGCFEEKKVFPTKRPHRPLMHRSESFFASLVQALLHGRGREAVKRPPHLSALVDVSGK